MLFFSETWGKKKVKEKRAKAIDEDVSYFISVVSDSL